MSTPNDTITLAEGQSWTAAWRSQNPNAVKAFLIPTDDLTGVLSERPDAVRAYLAIETKKDGSQEEKLVIVGCKLVNGVYEDMLPNAAGDNGNHLYDFTQPCPPICDPKSSLSQ